MGEESSPSHTSNSLLPSVPFLNPLTYDERKSQTVGTIFSWDLSAACRPLLTAFHYISGKLAYHGIHVAIVVKNSRPELLPAWPIGIQTQHLLSKFVQKANEKYTLDLPWLKALLGLCNPIEAREIFESQRAISYLVHRSIVQRDIIYSGDGLTVLAVDCIYTFKSLLADLGAENAIPLFRDDCKESCVELLKHVNKMYKDIVLSKGYLSRAYTQFTCSEDVLEEVCEAYRARFGLEGIFDAPIAMLDTRTARVRKSYSDRLAEQLQASPKKLPEPERVTNRQRAAQSARTALKGPRSVYMSQLSPPFQEPSTPVDSTEPDLCRPKSPKGSLFESPRSPPITPPRRARLRAMSKSDNLRADSSVSQDSGTLVDPFETPPAPKPIPKRRPFIGPLFALSSFTAPPMVREERSDRRGNSFDFKRSTSLSRSRSLKPSPEIASRASSTNRSIRTTMSRHRLANSLARLTSSLSASQPVSKFEWDQSRPSSLRGEKSKFGWLQVTKRRNNCSPSATQMVF